MYSPWANIVNTLVFVYPTVVDDDNNDVRVYLALHLHFCAQVRLDCLTCLSRAEKMKWRRWVEAREGWWRVRKTVEDWRRLGKLQKTGEAVEETRKAREDRWEAFMHHLATVSFLVDTLKVKQMQLRGWLNELLLLSRAVQEAASFDWAIIPIYSSI